MNYIGKFLSNFKDFYNEINSATLTGAIDVIVVQQPDGTYLCSPFHVRFGKIGVLRSREKVVDIEVNGRPVDIHMKLGESGEAFFVEEVEDENEIPQLWATSPLPNVPDIEAELQKMKLENENNDMNKESLVTESNAQSTTGHTSAENEGIFPYQKNNESSGNSQLQQAGLNPFEPVGKEYDESSCPLAEKSMLLADDVQDISKNKKRKRKRTSAKKRAKSKDLNTFSVVCSDQDAAGSANNDSDDESVGKPEDIFQMDDDYCETEEDEGYPCASHGLSRSVSLPVNSNKPLCPEWPSRKMSSTFTGEFHPFSDGDVTPPSSPTASRPASPKSDTEYENQKIDSLLSDSTEPSWGWGQLPNMPKNLQTSSQEQGLVAENGSSVVDTEGAEKRSMLGGMLSFMRSTKKIRHQPESEGILLQSVESTAIDPEIASLYFPRYRSAGLAQNSGLPLSIKDEDNESGKGPSLPQSPHSVEGAIGGPCSSIDSDCEERQYLYSFQTDVSMSLCGGLLDAEGELPEERFKNSLVTYDKFTENPSLLLNPNLVVKLGNKYYNWQAAAPMLTSMVMFQRALPEKTVNQLVTEHMPKKKKSKSYSSWWSWRRSEDVSSKAESTTTESGGSPVSEHADAKPEEGSLIEVVCDKSKAATKPETDFTAEGIELTLNASESIVVLQEEVGVGEQFLDQKSPMEQRKDSLVEAASGSSTVINVPARSGSQMKDDVAASPEVDVHNLSVPREFENSEPKKEKYKKSLRLTSEQISSLNLMQGPNEVVFSVTTAYQGTTRCKCDIYLWNYDDKIVISDIDGTITKSDVLGHILPMVGKDWAQLGVAGLFTKINENGYKFLYLSARAIGQARITRDYLRSIRQGKVCLPDGPLLLSPTSLISALHREVIERKPEEFKISCLKDIQTLYPSFMGNPFYAGFGNKINDTWAYRAVGIPTTRIFTINHRGELKLELIQTFQSSYTRLSDQVDHIFPPQNVCRKINGLPAPSFTASEEFSYFTYWRQPICTIVDEELPV